jgi:hypothetical protein
MTEQEANSPGHSKEKKKSRLPTRFRQLAAQRERLEQKLGHGVEFDVRVEGGKVKLAARRAGDGSEE